MMATHSAILAASARTPLTGLRRASAPRANAMSGVAPAARLDSVTLQRQRSRARATLTARASAASRGVAGFASLTVVPGPGARRTARGRVSVVTRAAKKKRSPEEIRARREARERREREEAELAAFEEEEAARLAAQEGDAEEGAGFDSEASAEAGEGEEAEEEEEEDSAAARARSSSCRSAAR